MSDLSWPTGGGQGSGARESFNSGLTGRVARGSPVDEHPSEAGTHRLRVEPTRSIRAVSGKVEALLGGLEARSARRAALLASELIAQVSGRPPVSGDEPVELTIRLRDDVVRLEATGPVAPAVRAPADPDPVCADPHADWGRFILGRLADRWGGGKGARPSIWAEIEAPA
jgi:hypothetical protein